MRYLTKNLLDYGKYYPYVDISGKDYWLVTINDRYKLLAYYTGFNVKIVNKQEYFESIIVDGEERITSPDVSGGLVVETLSDPEVKVKFKPGITSVSDCFSGVTSLIFIPGNLFYSNPEITSFSGCFYGCSDLKAVQTELFSNNLEVTDFNYSFANCTSLTTIPENLFSNNLEVTYFNGSFYRCSSLTTIPENLFTNNTKIINFRNCFDNCSNLLVMPKDNDGTPVYNRSTPGKNGYNIVTDYSECFRNCTSIEGYDQIPEDWK